MTTSKNNPELGDEVQEIVTGFRGIITSIAQCLTGCDRITIRGPMTKDGKIGDEYWFDITSVKIIKKGKVKPASVQSAAEEPQRKVGGPPSRNFP